MNGMLIATVWKSIFYDYYPSMCVCVWCEIERKRALDSACVRTRTIKHNPKRSGKKCFEHHWYHRKHIIYILVIDPTIENKFYHNRFDFIISFLVQHWTKAQCRARKTKDTIQPKNQQKKNNKKRKKKWIRNQFVPNRFRNPKMCVILHFEFGWHKHLSHMDRNQVAWY